MKKLLALGAGPTGPLVAGKFARRLEEHRRVQIVDLDDERHYEPGHLVVPFQRIHPDGAKPAPFPP